MTLHSMCQSHVLIKKLTFISKLLKQLGQSSNYHHIVAVNTVTGQLRNSLTHVNVSSQLDNFKSNCSRNRTCKQLKSLYVQHDWLKLTARSNSLQCKRRYHCLRQKTKLNNKQDVILSGCQSVLCVHTSTCLQAKRTELNPLTEIQKFMEGPIFPDGELIFKPTIAEMREASQMFTQRNHKIEFLKSAVFQEHLPEYDLPEVAFVGRSNVGKSSLIRVLFHAVDDLTVKVSSKPGHTRTLNFFRVGKCFSLVDMPGYGFNMPRHFEESVETFLSTRKKLVRSFVLIDGSVGITKADIIGLDMMREFGLPFVMTFILIDSTVGTTMLDEAFLDKVMAMNINFSIVLTKIDKAKKTTLLKNLVTVLEYRKRSHTCFHQPFLISSVTGDGLALLQTFIAYVTSNIAIKGL